MNKFIEISNNEKSYTIYEIDNYDWKYWLENEEEEAMSLSEKNLFDLIDEYFKSEF